MGSTPVPSWDVRVHFERNEYSGGERKIVSPDTWEFPSPSPHFEKTCFKVRWDFGFTLTIVLL